MSSRLTLSVDRSVLFCHQMREIIRVISITALLFAVCAVGVVTASHRNDAPPHDARPPASEPTDSTPTPSPAASPPTTATTPTTTSSCGSLSAATCVALNRWPCTDHSIFENTRRFQTPVDVSTDGGGGTTPTASGKCGPCFDGYYHHRDSSDEDSLHGTGQCLPCSPLCYDCSGPTSENCVSCAPGYSFHQFEWSDAASASAGGDVPTITRRRLCTPNCNNSGNYISLLLLAVAQLWCSFSVVIPIVRWFQIIIKTHSTVSSFVSDVDHRSLAAAAEASLSFRTVNLPFGSSAGNSGGANELRTGLVVVTVFIGFALSNVLLDEMEWAPDTKYDWLLILQIATAMSLPLVGLFQTKVRTPSPLAVID